MFKNISFILFKIIECRVFFKVERNMRVAVKRNAILDEQFYFRKKLTCSEYFIFFNFFSGLRDLNLRN